MVQGRETGDPSCTVALLLASQSSVRPRPNLKKKIKLEISGTFPIDTTKTRLQIQGQKLDKNHATLKYRGMVDCLLKIGRTEGVAALYSG